MATKIEWVTNPDGTKGESWNPVTGCDKVDPGCANCYAERMSKRLRGRCGYPADDPFRVTLHPDRLDKPLHWRKPRRVFVNSMSDLFHKNVPGSFVNDVFAVMSIASDLQPGPSHEFMILTKRPDRMQNYFDNPHRWGRVAHKARDRGHLISAAPHGWPLPNVWLGVSVHDQASADERIPILLQTPAAKRFVSIEPCLGAVDITRWLRPKPDCIAIADDGTCLHVENMTPECHAGVACPVTNQWLGIDYVILGGESGPGARPMHPDWARSVRDQCEAAGVPVMFKQWGAWAPWRPELVLFDDKRQVYPNGDWIKWGIAPAKFTSSNRSALMVKTGKKIAGRLLDGKIHNGEV